VNGLQSNVAMFGMAFLAVAAVVLSILREEIADRIHEWWSR